MIHAIIKRFYIKIAKANIAIFLLHHCCDCRKISGMNTEANAVLDHLGGTSKVAALIHAPVSTVHSWREIGIPASRMAHLRLASRETATPLPDDTSGIIADWLAKQAPTEPQRLAS